MPRGETVKLKISLGSSSVSMPNLSGMTEEEAIIELMKMGFFYDSITVMETYDTDAAAEKVVETDPKAGVTVNPAGSVKIFVNTYVEESSSAPASTSRPVSTISRPSSSSSAASTSSSASTSSPSDTTTSRSEED